MENPRNQVDIQALDRQLRQAAELLEQLRQNGGDMPFIDRNARRALASIKMMALGVSDLAALDS